MRKTGTSSIQRSLAGYSDAEFVYYSESKGRPNHTPAIFGLLERFAPRPDERTELGRARRNAQRDFDPRARERFADTVRAVGERTLIISGEGIMFLSLTELQDLAAFLQTTSIQKLEVVAYVRPFAAYVTSVARATKGGALKNLSLERRTSRYRAAFEKFDQVFGRENVQLWKFDQQSFPSGCVVKDFSTRLGISLPPERIVRVNESISREIVALLYTYYRLGRSLGARNMSAGEKYRLIKWLGNLGDKKFRFSPDLLRPMLEKNRVDIEWMETRLGESLQEQLGEHQPGDVQDKWDLLRPDPIVVEKLLQLLGRRAPKGVTGKTPEEVAQLVHAVREESRSSSRRGIDAPRRPKRATRVSRLKLTAAQVSAS
jgi:hypothetical protein